MVAAAIGALLLLGGPAWATEPRPMVADEATRHQAATGKDRKPLVAVPPFENKSTYSADKLPDTSAELLTAVLVRDGRFRVVEWQRLKLLFDRQTLSTVDIVQKAESRDQARKILQCEYFLIGTVTRFDVAIKGNSSAFSKKKEYTTTVRVDLMLIDGATGEYVSQGTGERTEVQAYTGSLASGQTGTWDPASGSKALEAAIEMAVSKLVVPAEPAERR